MPQDLDNDVIVFLQRAIPHYLAGKSVEDSLRAVLDDDARLLNATFNRGSYTYFPTPDERGISRRRPDQTGDVIFSEISKAVYQRLQVQA